MENSENYKYLNNYRFQDNNISYPKGVSTLFNSINGINDELINENNSSHSSSLKHQHQNSFQVNFSEKYFSFGSNILNTLNIEFEEEPRDKDNNLEEFVHLNKNLTPKNNLVITCNFNFSMEGNRRKMSLQQKGFKNNMKYETPFKAIKTEICKFLINITNFEKNKVGKERDILCDIISNLRFYFTTNSNKKDNRTYLEMTIKMIITYIYEVSIPKRIEAIKANNNRNGKPLKVESKKNEEEIMKLIEPLEKSQSTVDIAEFNFEEFFSEKSMELLNKTYTYFIREFQKQDSIKKYLSKIKGKGKGEQYQSNSLAIATKFFDYLGSDNSKKIKKSFVIEI